MNTRIGILAANLAVIGYCVMATPSAEATGRCQASEACRAAAAEARSQFIRRGDQTVAETANFRIYGLQSRDHAAWCAQRLEALRTRLQKCWLGNAEHAAWSRKCEVVVHGTFDAYLRQAGPGAESTLGASRIEFDHGQVAARRIDIRADKPGWFDAVVPHELSHIVLADEFPCGNLPAWADEGMAVLADSPEKQALHLRDAGTARKTGAATTLAGFITQRDYPCASEMPAFYGRSVSLVRLLVDRQTPADFVRFLHRAETGGYEAALRECYGIDGAADLERHWRRAATVAHLAYVAP